MAISQFLSAALVSILVAQTMASPTRTELEAAEPVAVAARSASPTPSPVVQLTRHFVAGDVYCGWTSSTNGYPYNTCNNLGDTYSVALTAPKAKYAYEFWSGANCTGHRQTAPINTTSCIVPKFPDGYNGTEFLSFKICY